MTHVVATLEPQLLHRLAFTRRALSSGPLIRISR